MLELGAFLILAGLGALLGYAGYYFGRSFFTSDSVPLPVRVAVPAIVVGFLLLLAGVIWERFRRFREREEKEIEKVEK